MLTVPLGTWLLLGTGAGGKAGESRIPVCYTNNGFLYSGKVYVPLVSHCPTYLLCGIAG